MHEAFQGRQGANDVNVDGNVDMVEAGTGCGRCREQSGGVVLHLGLQAGLSPLA